MDRIAFVGGDRQVHVIRPDGSDRQQVTWAPGEVTIWGGIGGRSSRAWPTWSPDGQWLSCFQLEGGADQMAQARICVVQVDGVEERVLVEMDGQIPIYMRWNEDSRQLAALVQDEDGLELWTVDRDNLGQQRTVDHGSPLFFAWAPTPPYMMLHVGGSRRPGRLVLRNLGPTGEDVVFDALPGAFSAPVFTDEHLIYATGRGWLSNVCVSDHLGQRPQILASMEGQLSIMPSSDGQQLAIGAGPRTADGGIRRVWLAGMDGTGMRPIIDDACQAFFWVPGRAQIIYARSAADRRRLTWVRQDISTGQQKTLGDFWPSRDQRFVMHFFEQYTHSHPPISSDGRFLVYSGHPAPGSHPDTSPRLWIIDLDDDDPHPRMLAEGAFGVFRPTPTARPTARSGEIDAPTGHP
ncbi:MAG: hypothetical protein AAFV53_29500 [Myxococcota bacterium]